MSFSWITKSTAKLRRPTLSSQACIQAHGPCGLKIHFRNKISYGIYYKKMNYAIP